MMNMKKLGRVAATAAMAGGALLASGSAFAQWHHHGPRVVFGLNFGVPVYSPYYYSPYPYYYPPAVVTVPAPQPPVYVERSDPAPAPQVQNDWYYCAGSRAYYPYVKDCPGGWQRVPAQPAQ